jgi:hypothetical protein
MRVDRSSDEAGSSNRLRIVKYSKLPHWKKGNHLNLDILGDLVYVGRICKGGFSG